MPSRARRLQEEARKAQQYSEEVRLDTDPDDLSDMPDGADVPDLVEDEPMAMQSQEKTMWVRFTIPGSGVFTYRGQNYDRGQLITLTGGPRDEQLERLGYVQLAPKGESHLQAECGVCGCWFLTEQFRDAHGRQRHSDRFQDDVEIGGGMAGPDGGAALRDTTGDSEERRMQQQYPLYLDRTKATLESGAA